MTLSKRYLLGFDEIRSLRITCTACQASLNLPISKIGYAPERCPSCRENDWFHKNGVEHTAVLRLLDDITMLRDRKSPACLLSFETDQPAS